MVKTSWLSRNLARRKGSDDVVLVGEKHVVEGDPQSPRFDLPKNGGNSSHDYAFFASGEEDQANIASNGECALQRLALKVVHTDAVSSCALLHQQEVSYLISCGLDGNLIVQIVGGSELKTETAHSQCKLRILSRTLPTETQTKNCEATISKLVRRFQ
jgi:hypothetical protein